MGARHSALIDFTEAVYEVELQHDDWVRGILEAGAPVLDHGLGVLALTVVRPPQSAPVRIERVQVIAGPDDMVERVRSLETHVDMEMLWPLGRPGVPKTLSEVTEHRDPAAFPAIMAHFGFAKDALGLSAFEPSGRGVYLVIALPTITSLSARARERWQMLAAHFGAGYRLRRAIEDHGPEPEVEDALPFGAEAVIDPTDFHVAEATGRAASRPALTALRNAAREVDRARGQLRESDPEKALEIWRALVRGRWSTVDWFDSGGRRYVLGVPNPPEVLDPRGLTERELQVVSYAVSGMTSKMIGYHLGVSKGRVSTLLASAMRKLGVQSRGQLVKRIKDFGAFEPG